jgi:hypothetical protein
MRDVWGVVMREELRGLTARDCYARVYAYLRSQARDARRGPASWLPDPDCASDADVDFVLGEVIFGGLEHFFTAADRHGVKLSEYARHALETRYGGSFLLSGSFRASCRSSTLFPQLSRHAL